MNFNDAELDEARRRWGEHVSAVYHAPAVPDDTTCPVSFGDVVRIEDGTLGAVFVPDLGITMHQMFEVLPDFTLVDPDPQTVMVSWELIDRAVATVTELPYSTLQFLEPFRKCVVLNESHWDTGIDFLDSDNETQFAAGDTSGFDLGDLRNINQFFGEEVGADDFRVLVHTESDWSTWKCFELTSANEVEELAANLPSMFRRPIAIRKGVYETDADTMNKFEIWHGRRKVGEHSFVVGQGQRPGLHY